MSSSNHAHTKRVDDATATQAPAPAQDAASAGATEGFLPQEDGASYPINHGRPGAAFYVPHTSPPTGAVLKARRDGTQEGLIVQHMNQGKTIPKLFEPLTIRGVEFKNRIWVCQFVGDAAEQRHGQSYVPVFRAA